MHFHARIKQRASISVVVDEFYVASTVKYRRIIALMQNFFSDVWGNNQKDTKLDHAKLHLLLKETEFLSDKNS